MVLTASVLAVTICKLATSVAVSPSAHLQGLLNMLMESLLLSVTRSEPLERNT